VKVRYSKLDLSSGVHSSIPKTANTILPLWAVSRYLHVCIPALSVCLQYESALRKIYLVCSKHILQTRLNDGAGEQCLVAEQVSIDRNWNDELWQNIMCKVRSG
jgi:hypothetical protein